MKKQSNKQGNKQNNTQANKNKKKRNPSTIAKPTNAEVAIYEGQNYDRVFHAFISKVGTWLSPTACVLAYVDWLTYLNISPAKRYALINNAIKKAALFTIFLKTDCTNSSCKPCISLRQNDHRFRSEMWKQFPFNIYSQGFLLIEQWWDEATKNLHGVSQHHQNMVNFMSRQLLDMYSPSIFPWTNPEVINKTIEQGGFNFISGFNNYIEDVMRKINNKPPKGSEKYKVGVNIAITPGKVIYRNRLIELIQYTPTTSSVYAEPILIVPAWIMKYYILDLSADNSMVKYLVAKGHTVFMISWKNPDTNDRNLALSDYVKYGVLDALKTIKKIVPKQKVHSVGYCIGGTLLMIAAAKLAKSRNSILKTITLFAAEIDFRDAGELRLFIDENQITFLEDIMWEKGYLDGAQMAGAFSMLRSIDLIWSKVVRDYLVGERQPVNDLMAWDYDTTRLPYKMHSEYLRSLFLNNDLVEGRFKIDNEAISLPDISVPIFVVSTIKDHVAPWKSVYKIHYFTDTKITFVLTNAGHNTGIVNEPGEPGRSYQMLTHGRHDKHYAPDTWQQKAPQFDGSWWPAWESWITDYSSTTKTRLPPMGNPQKGVTILCDAPGTYVFQK